MLTRTITILFILTAFISCSKDTSNGTNSYNPGYMSAYIGSSYWYATTGYAQTPNVNAINLYAAYNNQSHISIALGGYTGPGNYILGGFNGADFYDGNGNDYTATSGTITITSDNGTQVLGIFTFSGIGSFTGGEVSITGGQFNLTR